MFGGFGPLALLETYPAASESATHCNSLCRRLLVAKYTKLLVYGKPCVKLSDTIVPARRHIANPHGRAPLESRTFWAYLGTMDG